MASPQVAGLAALYAGMKGYTTATPGAPLKIWRALQLGSDSISGSPNWEGSSAPESLQTMPSKYPQRRKVQPRAAGSALRAGQEATLAQEKV